ncbi:SMI1/KNR4 family protein [Bacillus marasmi]|uniref:SMI1/KNR4 family protein n=1 Tax=Bacillus marasmi TaxID=1926279 RepID=UPI0011C91243|nr:SMI1/KNR4 family protein [Bacillus marasmi]
MTDDKIIFEAKCLVNRIKLKYPNFVGKIVSDTEIEKIEKDLNIKLPEWYIALYKTVPLINSEFGIPEFEPDEDFDGISYIIWDGVDDIIDECTKYEPGISALKDGFIFVASCSHGSGDPIFIKLNSNQPSVFRIYHDDLTKVQLVDNLAYLFKNAII